MPDTLNTPHSFTALTCGCSQCELRAELEASAELSALAAHEAENIRFELEKLYSDSLSVGGEVRYHLLWRLSELERIRTSITRFGQQTVNADEMASAKDQIAVHSRRACELQQEARLLLDAWTRPRGRFASLRSQPASSNSSRRIAPSPSLV